MAVAIDYCSSLIASIVRYIYFFHLYASLNDRVDKNVSKRSCKIQIQLLEIAF